MLWTVYGGGGMEKSTLALSAEERLTLSGRRGVRVVLSLAGERSRDETSFFFLLVLGIKDCCCSIIYQRSRCAKFEAHLLIVSAIISTNSHVDTGIYKCTVVSCFQSDLLQPHPSYSVSSKHPPSIPTPDFQVSQLISLIKKWCRPQLRRRVL